MTDKMVIYHGGCMDGFTAAWAAYRRFGDGPDVRYYAARHGDPPPDVTGMDVWILDFSYPRPTLLEMHEKASSLLVLDHHHTAQEDLEGLDFAVFDMDRSGAGIAWDHFHPDQPRPAVVDYVEDRDLWRFQLRHSKEANAFIRTLRQTFGDWDQFFLMSPGVFVSYGRVALAVVNQYVDAIVEHAQYKEMAGRTVLMVNAPHVHTSELIGRLAECPNTPFAVGWFERGDGRFQYSLRSRGDFDVSVIAKQFGGGGHKQAAGFVWHKPPDEHGLFLFGG